MRKNHSSIPAAGRPANIPPGMAAIGIFWYFGAMMASFAGLTLMWPGTVADRLWELNASGHVQLLLLGRKVGFGFFLLSIILVFAGIGWFQRRTWGWTLAVIVLMTQVLGDLVNAWMGQFARGITGAIIAGALMFYLFRQEVRNAFGKAGGHNEPPTNSSHPRLLI
jgi:hypothetical protein